MNYYSASAMMIVALIIAFMMEEPYGFKQRIVAVVGLSGSVILCWDTNESLAANLFVTQGLFFIGSWVFWWEHTSFLRILCDMYIVTLFPFHLVIYWLNRLITHLTSGKIPVFIMDPMRIADAHPKY
ncbi:hypothetical protein CPPEL_10955 [Corynebacterium pseudopelargi]|uniref:Uncharacterized protein n=2 Tax=Corynebacterium pseudopelargi TaxID=2080757 RepID=A0A3G6IWX6_9CORY|nr:hypothetical protein CPPEL_10950 [Corynebacterium pseudopelargi]AZA10282.1 hypothetical protein CPPEL_10955 [Corynebacterium pseudopelargi]